MTERIPAGPSVTAVRLIRDDIAERVRGLLADLGIGIEAKHSKRD